MIDEIAVVRVHEKGGSHIEPPCDESWSDFDKLRWHAAVVAADTGLRVSVRDAALQRQDRRGKWKPVPGYYSINVGNCSTSAYSFDRAWTYLNGVSTGAEQKRREDFS